MENLDISGNALTSIIASTSIYLHCEQTNAIHQQNETSISGFPRRGAFHHISKKDIQAEVALLLVWYDDSWHEQLLVPQSVTARSVFS